MITIIARSLMPLLVMMLSVTSVTVAHAKSRCVVADPSGTTLNVRTTPNGKIVSTLLRGDAIANAAAYKPSASTNGELHNDRHWLHG